MEMWAVVEFVKGKMEAVILATQLPMSWPRGSLSSSGIAPGKGEWWPGFSTWVDSPTDTMALA